MLGLNSTKTLNILRTSVGQSSLECFRMFEDISQDLQGLLDIKFSVILQGLQGHLGSSTFDLRHSKNIRRTFQEHSKTLEGPPPMPPIVKSRPSRPSRHLGGEVLGPQAEQRGLSHLDHMASWPMASYGILWHPMAHGFPWHVLHVWKDLEGMYTR